jgi:hypothetical protein
LARLNDPSTTKFYELLASYSPPPPETGSIKVEEPDPLKEFPDLPVRPDLSFPGDDDSASDTESSASAPAKETESGGTTSSKEESKSGESADAVEKSSTLDDSKEESKSPEKTP